MIKHIQHMLAKRKTTERLVRLLEKLHTPGEKSSDILEDIRLALEDDVDMRANGILAC